MLGVGVERGGGREGEGGIAVRQTFVKSLKWEWKSDSDPYLESYSCTKRDAESDSDRKRTATQPHSQILAAYYARAFAFVFLASLLGRMGVGFFRFPEFKSLRVFLYLFLTSEPVKKCQPAYNARLLTVQISDTSRIAIMIFYF